MNEIEKDNLSSALETIVEADSELHEYWTNYLAEEYESGKYLDDRDFIEDMNAIANYLVEKWRSAQSVFLTKIFDTLEEIFSSRDELTCSILSAGLLESLQSYKDVDYHHGFDNWLRPKTKVWWEGAINYWEGTQ